MEPARHITADARNSRATSARLAWRCAAEVLRLPCTDASRARAPLPRPSKCEHSRRCLVTAIVPPVKPGQPAMDAGQSRPSRFSVDVQARMDERDALPLTWASCPSSVVVEVLMLARALCGARHR